MGDPLSEILLIVAMLAINTVLVMLAARFVWWLFQKVVRGTGSAWRGD